MSEVHSPFPLPSAVPQTERQTHSEVLINDEKALVQLIDQLLVRAGLNQAEVCKRLGISQSNFNQYRLRRRTKPSVWWLLRLAHVCGAKLIVEFPRRAVVGDDY